MKEMGRKQCGELRSLVANGIPTSVAILKAAGGMQLGHGVWRLFSEHFPKGGCIAWNNDSQWKPAWAIEPGSFHAFGEDVFGNQLIVSQAFAEAGFWNHETGEVASFPLEVADLFEAVIQNGLAWLDQYHPQALRIAMNRVAHLDSDCHLHWTVPLALGGTVADSNVSVVERLPHLVGHAKLWAQIAGLDEGDSVVLRP